jgi:molybdopterin synthase sulfur carrier subunit
MRALILIPAYRRTFADGRDRVELEFSSTVRDALESLRRIHPGVCARVLDECGQVRQHVSVFLDRDNTRDLVGLDTLAADGCEIYLLPSVSGGTAACTADFISRRVERHTGGSETMQKIIPFLWLDGNAE